MFYLFRVIRVRFFIFSRKNLFVSLAGLIIFSRENLLGFTLLVPFTFIVKGPFLLKKKGRKGPFLLKKKKREKEIRTFFFRVKKSQ